MTFGLARAGSHPKILYSLMTRLSTSSLEAQVRRERLKILGTAITTSAARLWIKGRQPELTAEQTSLLYSSSSRPSTSSLECLTNFTGICENCLYLDHAIGHAEHVDVAMAYYSGCDEPSYTNSLNQYTALRDYIADPLLPAQVGDSNGNPLRWPWFDRSNWKIIGDPTLNKMGFSDLVPLWAQTYDLLVNGNSPLDSFGVSTTVTINRLFETAAVKIIKGIYHPVFNVSSSTIHAAVSTADARTVITQWFNYFYSWIRTCNFREELDGSMKRFSIGESVAIMTGVAGTLGIILGAIFPGQMLLLMGGAGSALGMGLLMGTLVVSYSWSFGCYTAFPQQMADDTMHFLTHTLFTRGPWLLGGIVTNDTFTNEQGVLCDNYAPTIEGGYEFADCINDVGFLDAGYNFGFALRTLAPDTLQWLNDTDTILINYIMHLDFVQERINAFPDYNATDAISYSVHNSCAFVYTAAPNYWILQAALRVATLLRPFIGLALQTILALIMLASAALLLIYALFQLLFQIPIAAAQAQEKAFDQPDSIHHTVAIREPVGVRLLKKFKARLAMRRALRLY